MLSVTPYARKNSQAAPSARGNILMGKPSATETEVLEAAQAWEFLRTLPKSFDTQLGGRGIALSGGQR